MPAVGLLVLGLLATGNLTSGCAELATAGNQSTQAMPVTGQALAKAAPEDASEAMAEEIPQAMADKTNTLADFKTAAGTADNQDTAAAYIESLGREVITALADTSKPEAQRIKFFGTLLARDLDIQRIARFVLGRHWHTANSAQRRTYVAVFTDFIVQTYSIRLGGAKVDNFEILTAREISRKDYLVRSRVTRANAKPINADWRLSLRQGRYRILDLTVEGISMALLLRQEFASVLRDKGGVDGLIAMLRQRIT